MHTFIHIFYIKLLLFTKLLTITSACYHQESNEEESRCCIFVGTILTSRRRLSGARATQSTHGLIIQEIHANVDDPDDRREPIRRSIKLDL